VQCARATLASARRVDEREARSDAAALRGAARLVWLDLALCDTNLEWAIASRQWPGAEAMVPMHAWDEHAERLAAGIASSRQLTTGHCPAVPTRASQSDSRR